MKPSERITKLVKHKPRESDFDFFVAEFKALLDYLDEEYEKNKPCEHKETEVWDMNIGEVCKKCKVRV